MVSTKTCSAILIIAFLLVLACILKVVYDLNVNKTVSNTLSRASDQQTTKEPFKCSSCTMR